MSAMRGTNRSASYAPQGGLLDARLPGFQTWLKTLGLRLSATPVSGHLAAESSHLFGASD